MNVFCLHEMDIIHCVMKFSMVFLDFRLTQAGSVWAPVHAEETIDE